MSELPRKFSVMAESKAHTSCLEKGAEAGSSFEFCKLSTQQQKFDRQSKRSFDSASRDDEEALLLPSLLSNPPPPYPSRLPMTWRNIRDIFSSTTDTGGTTNHAQGEAEMSTNMEADPIEEANGTINTNRCIITQSGSGIDTIFLRRQRSTKKVAGYGTLLMFLCFLACILAISLGTPKAIAWINGQPASSDAFFTQVVVAISGLSIVYTMFWFLKKFCKGFYSNDRREDRSIWESFIRNAWARNVVLFIALAVIIAYKNPIVSNSKSSTIAPDLSSSTADIATTPSLSTTPPIAAPTTFLVVHTASSEVQSSTQAAFLTEALASIV